LLVALVVSVVGVCGLEVDGAAPLASAPPPPTAPFAPPPAAPDACGGQDYGVSGQFDFYVFEQTWSAEFCQTKKSWPGCKTPTQFMQNHLTIHGLWPNYASSREGHMWPQCCNSTFGQNVDSLVVQQLFSDLKTYWPNEQLPDPPLKDLSATLWQHEWNKHGTCSGVSQRSYFSGTMTTVYNQVPTPASLQKRMGGSMQKQELVSSYSKVVKPQCTGGYLMSINSCFNKNMGWIDCPSTGGRDTCPASFNVRKF